MKTHELTAEQQAAWDGWVAARPPSVRALCARFAPNVLYRLKGGSRVTIYSFEESGTLTVNVTGEYNRVAFARRVFGVRPEDLEECDLPGPDEKLGAELTDPEEINNFVRLTRASILGVPNHVEPSEPWPRH